MVWYVYLPTLDEKWPQSKGNVGKYSLYYMDPVGYERIHPQTMQDFTVQRFWQKVNRTQKNIYIYIYINICIHVPCFLICVSHNFLSANCTGQSEHAKIT